MVTPSRLGLLVTLAVSSAFLWFMTQIPAVTAGSAPTFRAAWVPFLDVAFTLRLDGLALLFAILITGIGVIIGVYSLTYMDHKPETRRYWVHLALFTLSMLGTVVAGDLITMYVFWELTAITSFLLIGYERRKEGARFAAWQALLITVAGGLTMLGGITALPTVTGTYDLASILTMGTAVRGHALYLFSPGL